MLRKSTYALFDFENTWTMNGNIDYLFPELNDNPMNSFKKEMVIIKLSSKPAKLIYCEGEEFDSSGMVITAYYNDGSSDRIENYMVNGYSASVGTKTITITYADKSVAFEVEVNAHDYRMNYDSDNHWQECSICRQKTDTAKHEYTNNCDTKCNKCNATRSISHIHMTTTTKATLSKNGSIVQKCSVCGNVKSTKTIYRPTSFSLSTTSYTYNGSAKKPTVTVKDAKGNKLISGTDYTVSYATGRTNPGKYKVAVTLKGNYSGTKSLYFTISPKAPSKLSVSSRSTSTIKLNWPKATGATGYRIYRYDSSTGTYKTVATTTNLSYTVKNLKSATNYKFAIKSYKKLSDGTTIWSGYRSLTTATRPVAPLIESIKSISKGKVSLMWSDVARESGYQIYYSTSKTGNYKLFDMTSLNDVFETYSGLKSGRTYYFKVRAFKTVNGNRIYSSFSAAKGIKIK